MTWNLNLIGAASECHNTLADMVTKAKIGRDTIEQEHIDLAVATFKRLVPVNGKLKCNFVASGYQGKSKDVLFNFMCNVHP